MFIMEPLYEAECVFCRTHLRYKEQEIFNKYWIKCPKCGEYVFANTLFDPVDYIMKEVESE